jgi:hypothetical protein
MNKQVKGFFSKAKNLGSKGVDAAKSGYSKAKQKTSTAIRDKKRQIAYEVLQETRALVPNSKVYKKANMMQSSLLNEASNVVEEYYAKGSTISSSIKKGDFISVNRGISGFKDSPYYSNKKFEVVNVEKHPSDKGRFIVEYINSKGNIEKNHIDNVDKVEAYAKGGGLDDLLEQDIISKIQYYPKGLPPKNHKYGVRYKGKTYTSNDSDDLVQKVLLETNKFAKGGQIKEIVEIKGHSIKHIKNSYDDYWYFVYNSTPFEFETKDDAIKSLNDLIKTNKYAQGGDINTTTFNYEIGGL